MLLTEKVRIRWTNLNREYYESKGLKFTKCRDYFECEIDKLPDGSHAEIQIKCDYCGKIITKEWRLYVKHNLKSKIKSDCCNDCKIIKSRLSHFKEHGVYSSMQREEIRIKTSNNNSRKHTFNFIYNEFLKRDYLLLDKEYKNNRTKMKYICNKHPNIIQEINYHNLDNNKGCKFCSIEKVSGENNHNYKGGITPLQNYMRDKITQWKIDSMKEYNYKCVVTGENFDVIHHLYSFSNILKETLKELNYPTYNQVNKYTKKQLDLILNKLIKNHYKYGLGVLLTENIHLLYHSIYSRGDNTPEQFEEFVQRYYDGKFSNSLDEDNKSIII